MVGSKLRYPASQPMPDTVASLAIDHILHQISSQKSTDHDLSPLFVGIQGPQGIGKTTLASALAAGLASPPHSLRTVTFSIDDLYLEHEALQVVGHDNPGNGLLQGRGLPGTHDVELGRITLETLSKMGRKRGDNAHESMRIPVYDKSLHSGLGDRLPLEKWTVVQPPVDVVILEGWCFGFYPSSMDNLSEKWERRTELGMPTSVRLDNGIENIKTINEDLKGYVSSWYSYFTCFIQVAPTPLDNLDVIYKWRLQQEHSMKARNGGKGMSDEQVACFLDRYMPGYIFFEGPSAATAESDPRPWRGKGLKIMVDANRNFVRTEIF